MSRRPTNIKKFIQQGQEVQPGKEVTLNSRTPINIKMSHQHQEVNPTRSRSPSKVKKSHQCQDVPQASRSAYSKVKKCQHGQVQQGRSPGRSVPAKSWGPTNIKILINWLEEEFISAFPTLPSHPVPSHWCRFPDFGPDLDFFMQIGPNMNRIDKIEI